MSRTSRGSDAGPERKRRRPRRFLFSRGLLYNGPVDKKRTFLFLALGWILASGYGQSPISPRKLATLGPGEYIVTDESVLLTGGAAGGIADDFFLVTQVRQSGKTVFFTYDKSGRNGPFDKMTDSQLRKGTPAGEPRKFYYEPEMSMDGIQEVTDPGDPSKHFLEYKGKRVGPFQQFLLASVTPDLSRVFALGVRDKKLRFASSDGRDVAAGGQPGALTFSPDGTKAVVKCMGTVTMYEGIQLKPEDMSPTMFDDVTLYTLDGKKYGPFNKKDDFGEVWFLADSSDWLFTVGPTAYFNGAPLKPFKDQIRKTSFWIDGTSHYAWLEDDQLKFSDGASYPNPVMMKWEKKAGKTTLCWISIGPNRDVAAYSREL
jgi:hypothetical protein